MPTIMEVSMQVFKKHRVNFFNINMGFILIAFVIGFHIYGIRGKAL